MQGWCSFLHFPDGVSAHGAFLLWYSRFGLYLSDGDQPLWRYKYCRQHAAPCFLFLSAHTIKVGLVTGSAGFATGRRLVCGRNQRSSTTFQVLDRLHGRV